MFGAISEKIRAFDMQINFAIPQFLTFVCVEDFFHFSRPQNLHRIINKLIRKVKRFLAIPDSPYDTQRLIDESYDDTLKKRVVFQPYCQSGITSSKGLNFYQVNF